MKLAVIAVGTRMPSWVNEGHAEYAKRMPRSSGLELIEIKPESRTSAKPVAQLLALEAERIRAALPKNSRVVALDEKGKDMSTVGLAEQMAAWMQEGGTTAFLIGSADGLCPTLKKAACMQWRLSSLTLPHGLVRVLLAEQLYRAVSLLNHHPYHRE